MWIIENFISFSYEIYTKNFRRSWMSQLRKVIILSDDHAIQNVKNKLELNWTDYYDSGWLLNRVVKWNLFSEIIKNK